MAGLFPAVSVCEKNFLELLLSILPDVWRRGPREPRHLESSPNSS